MFEVVSGTDLLFEKGNTRRLKKGRRAVPFSSPYDMRRTLHRTAVEEARCRHAYSE
ncbi:hypothetical protein BRPE64_ACDS10030 [Caballeronia insecticola]|uniref:Uncharacterized protein n=1 Tax=Caballeronia insecticola TaxID=758793 RepID=R4WXL0_9BURK|nr:hypothetical protein BRPE64_ACDS10030 [Caballeronia insecticola]